MGAVKTKLGRGWRVSDRHKSLRKIMPVAAETPDTPTLDIATDKLAFIIEKAREFDVKEGDSDPDTNSDEGGSNPSDDGNADILEDKPGDGTREELLGAIRELNDDERAELIALV